MLSTSQSKCRLKGLNFDLLEKLLTESNVENKFRDDFETWNRMSPVPACVPSYVYIAAEGRPPTNSAKHHIKYSSKWNEIEETPLQYTLSNTKDRKHGEVLPFQIFIIRLASYQNGVKILCPVPFEKIPCLDQVVNRSIDSVVLYEEENPFFELVSMATFLLTPEIHSKSYQYESGIQNTIEEESESLIGPEEEYRCRMKRQRSSQNMNDRRKRNDHRLPPSPSTYYSVRAMEIYENICTYLPPQSFQKCYRMFQSMLFDPGFSMMLDAGEARNDIRFHPEFLNPQGFVPGITVGTADLNAAEVFYGWNVWFKWTTGELNGLPTIEHDSEFSEKVFSTQKSSLSPEYLRYIRKLSRGTKLDLNVCIQTIFNSSLRMLVSAQGNLVRTSNLPTYWSSVVNCRNGSVAVYRHAVRCQKDEVTGNTRILLDVQDVSNCYPNMAHLPKLPDFSEKVKNGYC